MKEVAAEVNDSSQQKPNKIKAEIDELIVKDSETWVCTAEQLLLKKELLPGNTAAFHSFPVVCDNIYRS